MQLILSVGGLYSIDFEKKFPANAIILPYVPQVELLQHVDLMVSHGGSNSITESLSMGIPLAVIPLCNDQFFQARFLTRAKAGIVLDAKNPDVNKYRNALLELLAKNNIYKKNAQSIKESFDNYGGAKQIADLVCKVLRTGQPLKPNLAE